MRWDRANEAGREFLVENYLVTVGGWTFPPCAETGRYGHAAAYVVVPITAGTPVVRDAHGRRENNVVAGSLHH